MADGFEVIPDELERTADRIGAALGDVAGIVWRGPGGDYGHPAVETAWSRFVEDARDHVNVLRHSAAGHGVNLRDVASRYRDVDIASSDALGNCWLPNGGRSAGDSGIPGGGFAGGVAGVGDAPATGPIWVNPGWADTGALNNGGHRDPLDEGIHH
jgi:hypothetical protein